VVAEADKGVAVSYIVTYTGKRFDLPVPQLDQIDILDIATHQSRIPRFVGATSRFFSVAQHSIVVAYLSVSVTDYYAPPPHLSGFLMREMLKEGMGHDAHEAYMGDTPSPVKGILTGQDGAMPWRGLEHTIDAVIRQKFHLAKSMPPNVKTADVIALVLESDHLRGEGHLNYDSLDQEALGMIPKLSGCPWFKLAKTTIGYHWDCETAKDKFLKEWYRIES
jgi:5'-deoxynucleotidase YfbR-like HD superfamily hydrolase